MRKTHEEHRDASNGIETLRLVVMTVQRHRLAASSGGGSIRESPRTWDASCAKISASCNVAFRLASCRMPW